MSCAGKLVRNAPKAGCVRQLRRFVPPRGSRKRAHRFDGLKLALRDDREKAAVANDLQDARHFPHRGVVDAGELRAIARRPHDTGMDHAVRA